MKLTPQQRDLLSQLSQAEDTAEASALIEAFLSESKGTAPDRRPSTVQELFCDLLSGSGYSDAEIRDFIVRHGEYAAGIYVPVVFTELPNDGAKAEIEQMLATIPKSIWFLFESRYVLLTEFSHTAFPADQLLGLLKAHDLRAAAGRPCGDLSRLPVFVGQALDTLRYMRVLKKDVRICSYDQFTMIRLLDGLKDDVDFGNFQIEDVRALQTYDQENGTELCATLLCYLENSKSTSRTAKEMHIHRNSVYYRINKCMELLPDIDFENGTMTFLVMLSLYIAQYDFFISQKEYGTTKLCHLV
ncbi:MAG: helix-turn-helix domain-containing protein [Oscillospiraceae bacterium]|nr:helix-turn-helix domain-containing protein [Oscillospiraceae bacterium]